MPTHRLPLQPTSFIGREKELTQIIDLLADKNCRLLTIVGPGGIGKTRLALEVARQQETHFKDGIFDVALAPVVSPDLVVTTIADRLGLTFKGPDTPQVQLCRYLQDKHLLLVLDNFEHLFEASTLLSDLLRTAPELQILVTSRERLNLQEEWTVVLEGLDYPKGDSSKPLESFSAVRLFLQRARQAHVKFSLQAHADAVIAICRQVEGMPLGLELAASWLRVMPCEQVAAQMGHNLDFLATPLRNVPERHRSLRNVFEQSWHMLTGDEQAVLMRLSVFRGGFNLESAEAVAGATLSGLASLVDKSLIRASDNGRYDVHELLRQYAADKLNDAGLAEDIIQKHISYFLELAKQAEAYQFGREQIEWFDCLEIDFGNLRAAFARSSATETGLRLATALSWFFSERSYRNEGLMWLEEALTANSSAPASLRANALNRAGAFAGYFGDGQRIHRYCGEAIALARAHKDELNLAWSLSTLGVFIMEDNLSQSAAYLEESVTLFRKIGNSMGLAHTLIRLSWNALNQKDISYVHQLLDEAAILIRGAEDAITGAWLAITLARLAEQQHDFKQAKIYYDDAFVKFRQARFHDGMTTLVSLAHVELMMGNVNLAQQHYTEALVSHIAIVPNHTYIPVILAGLASIAKARRQFERSARLLAAAKDEWLIQLARMNPESFTYETDIVEVRTQLGDARFMEAWTAGCSMTRQQAVSYALEDSHASTKSPSPQPSVDQPFTERELEIVRLLADGLDSREIAQHLYLSVGTVRWYLKIIYSKLDAHSRSEAIARAKELNLLR